MCDKLYRLALFIQIFISRLLFFILKNHQNKAHLEVHCPEFLTIIHILGFYWNYMWLKMKRAKTDEKKIVTKVYVKRNQNTQFTVLLNYRWAVGFT